DAGDRREDRGGRGPPGARGRGGARRRATDVGGKAPPAARLREEDAVRIALTYNPRLADAEDEAEVDTERTVSALAAAIERLGHRPERFEVSGPASRTVARLEAYGPDLIFNTAEGRRGRFREAFFPALFDELGIPYTGSDAYALAVTL